MRVERCPLPEIEARVGADDAAIVVDALRASATIATLLDCGARGVRPVTDVDATGTDALTAGEHMGERIEGFDFGNSPLEIRDDEGVVDGREVVVKTTNGTECVNRVDHAAHVMTGSLVNETPLVETALDRLPADTRVHVVPARRHGEYTREDDYAAARIVRRFASALDEEPADLGRFDESAATIFRESNTGQYLIETGREDDVAYCATPNVCDAVPILEDDRFVDARRTVTR